MREQEACLSLRRLVKQHGSDCSEGLVGVMLPLRSERKEEPRCSALPSWVPPSVTLSCPPGPAARRDLADPDVPGAGAAGSCQAVCGAPPRGGARRGPGPCAAAQRLPPAGLLRG